MGKVQQQAGLRFESELLGLLTENGYRAHKLKTGVAGTAYDIAAVKNGRALAFECKTVAKGDALRYTGELQKKTDELDFYADGGRNPLYLAVRFGEGDVRFLRWEAARQRFLERGKVARGEMTKIEVLLCR